MESMGSHSVVWWGCENRVRVLDALNEFLFNSRLHGFHPCLVALIPALSWF